MQSSWPETKNQFMNTSLENCIFKVYSEENATQAGSVRFQPPSFKIFLPIKMRSYGHPSFSNYFLI